IADHLALELLNLTRTFEEMRPDLLTEAARLIHDAPRVWCMGFGAEDGLARLARLTLARLRPDVHLMAANPGAWAEDLAMTGPRDALVLLTLEPRPKFQAALTSYARTTRMNVITLTDHRYYATATRFSPRDALVLLTLEPRPKFQAALTSYARTTRMNVITLTDHRYYATATRFSRLVIGCHVATYGAVSSHTTLASVIRLLAIALIGHAGAPAADRMNLIADINEEIDLFD
ncbi:MAG: hypothetical protein MUF73_19670, partial [Rhodobacteraceae bacterium]|nr:hypothetical protein [Paracoccaceae bacterium]